MDNLYFLPNNILTRLFKELKKYKNDYCRDKGPKNVCWALGLKTLCGQRTDTQ